MLDFHAGLVCRCIGIETDLLISFGIRCLVK